MLKSMQVTSREVATYLDADHYGRESTIAGIASLNSAGDDELSFCTYESPKPVRESDAGAVICDPSIPPVDARTLIAVESPRLQFARAVNEFFVDASDETVVHPTAAVDDDATIGSGTMIGPNAFVGEGVTIGENCVVRAGASIGCAGFGFSRGPSGRLHRLPHRGEVRIEESVEIGANSTIDRAVFDETVIGHGTKLSANVHLAHQVEVGAHTTIAGGTIVAGSVDIGNRVTIHPNVSVATDVWIGDDAEVGMNAGVLDDVAPGTTVIGTPARSQSARSDYPR